VKDWITFILFMFVGLALFISGIIYLLKEKDDVESVKIYRIISLIGAVLIIISMLVKFVF
jgi:hypothetical protein